MIAIVLLMGLKLFLFNIFRNVYDVTKFLKEHPGGVESIMKFAGKEATKAFDLLHEKDVLTDP